MAGLAQFNNFWMHNNRVVDAKYKNGLVPWASKAEVLAAIPVGQRADVTVKILNQEWWWRDGEADEQLIQKITASGGTGTIEHFGVEDSVAQEDRIFDQNGYEFIFRGGKFTHRQGDTEGFAAPWGLFTLDTNSLHYEAGSDVTHALGLTIDGAAHVITIESQDPAGNSQFNFGNNAVSFWNVNGNVAIPFLTELAQAYAIQYDPATGKLSYAASSGSGSTMVGAENGVSVNGATNKVELGGSPLVKNTTLDLATYNLAITGAPVNSTAMLTLTKTGAGAGLVIESSNNPNNSVDIPLRIHQTGSTGSAALRIDQNSTTGARPLQVFSTNSGSIAIFGGEHPSIFNFDFSSLQVQQFVPSGQLPQNGLGTGIEWVLSTNNAGVRSTGIMSKISTIMTDVTHASRTAKMDFMVTGAGASTVKMSIAGNGQLTLTKYGVNTFAGSPAFGLGVDINGRLVEYTPGSGGGGGITAAHGINGLTDVTADTIRLGGSLNQNTTIDTGATFDLVFTGARTSSASVVQITNTVASGRVLSLTGNGATVLNITGNGGNGIQATVTGGGAVATLQGSDTNVSGYNTPVTVVHALTSGTVTTNFGTRIGFNLSTNDSSATAGMLGFKWTNAITATRTSAYEIFVTDAGTLYVAQTVKGSGQHQMNKYGAGTFTGTAAYALAVDASGNLIEIAASGSSGTGMANPMTAQGDIIYGGTGGTPTRLPIGGTIGQILSVGASNTLVWSSPGSTTWSGAVTSTSIAAGPVTLTNVPVSFFTGTSPQTWTMPARSTSTATMIIKNIGTANLTLNSAGADLFKDTGGTPASLTIVPGQHVWVNPASGFWHVVSDSRAVSGGVGGSPETNTVPGTLTTNGTLTVGVESILEYIIIQPVSTLTAFTAGVSGNATLYSPAVNIPGGVWTTLQVGEYISASTAVSFAGITSSTQIKLVYKPLHT